MTLSEKIKERRKQIGMTQDELAAKLNTTKQTISKYERGTVTNLPLNRIKELAKALDVEPGYLMGWEEKIVIPDDISDAKRDLIESVLDMPDDKIKALSELLKTFRG